MMGNTEYGHDRQKDILEKEAMRDEEKNKEQEEKQTEDEVNLIPQEQKEALKKTYRNFAVHRLWGN